MNSNRKLLLLILWLIVAIIEGTAQNLHESESIKLDIPYVQGGKHKQQLDVYTPNAKNFPTVLFIHGGSLTSGDRKDEPLSQIAKAFQKEGIGFVAMSYRIAPDSKWPSQPEDVVSAFDWVKRNIEEYGGDKEKVFLFGHSSGCHLATIVGADPNYLKKKGYDQKSISGIIALGCRLNNTLEIAKAPSPLYETYVIKESSVMKYFEMKEQIYTSLEQLNNAVPANHVDEKLPPTLVLMGDKERFFPPLLRDGSEFVGRALSRGAWADIKIIENRTHIEALEKMVSPYDPGFILVKDFIKNQK